jgi:hypothetical protein
MFVLVCSYIATVPLMLQHSYYYITDTEQCQVFFKEKEIKLISGLA